MSRTKLTGLSEGRGEIERRMSAGEPFGSVEDMINRAELSEDEKSALWLLAWSMRDTDSQRQETRALLAQLATVGD
ncbi:MAG TPA: hypothetical protein VF752_06845 [Thermoleophilaceae bacterium]